MRIKPFVPLIPNPKIAIVGEAPGETEEQMGEPFVGASGQELTRMLKDAGIVRHDCYLTNVFLDRPPNNDLKQWCISAKETKGAWLAWRERLYAEHPEVNWPVSYNWQYLEKGKYVHPQHLPEIYRLQRELQTIKPNIIIALGNTACWALTGSAGISKIRGVAATGHLVPGIKIIPTYHPAAVLRTWEHRVICVADFIKARREAEFADIRRPCREVWIEPSLDDLLEFERRYLSNHVLESIDVETALGQITCIGFAPNKEIAISVPFWDSRKPDWNYWSTEAEELAAWNWVAARCGSSVEKLFQNGLYDLQYIWRAHGIRVRNFSHDTMLMHHALQPELEKGLGFLGSIYTDEASWKVMRPRLNKEGKADA